MLLPGHLVFNYNSMSEIQKIKHLKKFEHSNKLLLMISNAFIYVSNCTFTHIVK